ncbi:MAG: SDR family oxidoreductase [Devosia sp.]|uniref:SDR family NAD(P)-dependent oxidoreductase n=1 Tax=Devosia sp. TaxID=1871048 RepID=UPI001A4C9765|nr:SDR family oxidoreductase [Devosia sp.]MBL8597502.1 SDR family oxidoreductase [Devosia sp.]
MSRRFAGRTALVTGAARGIGLAIAEELAAQGADIALHARKATAETALLAAQVAACHGVRVAIVAGDLADPEQHEAIFAAFDRRFDRLDILINNAGYEGPARLETMPLADWNGVLDVNLTAPFRVSQLAQPRMAASGGGVIVNISSIHEEVPRKGFAHYSVAKAGLRMLTRSCALEWAEFGIRAVTVSPGAIETDINRDVIEEIGRGTFDEWIPLGIGTTNDVAKLVAFICSDDARYMTGTEVYLDGGYMRNLVRYDGRPDR